MADAIKAKSERFGYRCRDFATMCAGGGVFGVKGYSKRHCRFYDSIVERKTVSIVIRGYAVSKNLPAISHC